MYGIFEKDIYAERYRGMTREEQTCCLTGHRIIPPGEESVKIRNRLPLTCVCRMRI